MKLPLLLVLLGPTGSGKTALAIELAEKLGGEIVSCDSVAVYRGLEIGTAKPTPEERRRVPHHLLDVVSPQEVFTAGDYSRLARQAIVEIRERHHLPIVAGGSGLYLRALLEGLFAGPPRSEELRGRLRESSPQHLHKMLRRLDPAAAAAIHANDVPKMIRALEVCISARRPMTGMWQQGRDPLRGFRILRLGLNPDREKLYERINARAARMFEMGLIEETRSLLERYGRSVPALDSLGYGQAAQHLRGESTLEEAIVQARQGHRNYAKRQLTWFRREPDVRWIAGFGDHPEVQRECMEQVRLALE